MIPSNLRATAKSAAAFVHGADIMLEMILERSRQPTKDDLEKVKRMTQQANELMFELLDALDNLRTK